MTEWSFTSTKKALSIERMNGAHGKEPILDSSFSLQKQGIAY